MTTARAVPPPPRNEPVRAYAPGSPERVSLQAGLADLAGSPITAPCVIAGRDITTGSTFDVRSPHDHSLHLATVHAAGPEEVKSAIEAALYAKPDWESLPWEERSAIFLRAAELLAGPWRDTLNASTMLGQSKTVVQAEIDAACELIDFWRFNVHFGAQLLAEQPLSSPDAWNRIDYRPLEGFVLAVSPFNFTSIAGNLPTAPALMGNTVVWKPSEKQAFSAYFLMELLRAAGLPDGVINLVHGDGAMVSDVCFEHPEFAGLHFTGSTLVFRELWRRVGEQLRRYRAYPRIVAETGGKDFLVAHPSADRDSLVTAMVRGAFEYQGQKCSALSRAYVPTSVWGDIHDRLIEVTSSLAVGDPTDFGNFMGAVIDRGAFERHRGAIEEARASIDADILVGGGTDDSIGWFVEPTIITTTNPQYRTMTEELFGPILSVYVYDDHEWESTLDLVDATSDYALTGCVFARDRAAVVRASERLRHSAGNFYVNDKPTGAVVGQQPFGGARGSGTNDKAGSILNLIRWVSPRTIKENLLPPTDHTYPHMRPDDGADLDEE